MSDIFKFYDKQVEIQLYRKKYNTTGHIKIHVGRLSDIGGNMICLERDGKYKWIPKPNQYKDSITELKI